MHLPWMFNHQSLPQRVDVYIDGAIRTKQGLSGLAAVALDLRGNICGWWSCQAGPMTNNEAEYEAALLALDMLSGKGVAQIEVFSDSQILVHQMQGLAAARAPALRQVRARLGSLVQRFQSVRFHHIPRQQNRLADALANMAVEGQLVTPHVKPRSRVL